MTAVATVPTTAAPAVARPRKHRRAALRWTVRAGSLLAALLLWQWLTASDVTAGSPSAYVVSTVTRWPAICARSAAHAASSGSLVVTTSPSGVVTLCSFCSSAIATPIRR